MGSVHYLPPEQASGKGCTIKSDIYSMGIIFYELLTGSLPFRGDNAVEIALKHMREPLPSLREENPAIPQSVENIIRRATAKNPKNRYENARSMHEDLLTALDDNRINEPVYEYKYPENENEGKRNKKKEEAAEDASVDAKIEAIGEDTSTNTKVEKLIPTEEKEEKKNKIVIIILAVVFCLIAIGLVVLFLVLPRFSNGKAATIPDCTNLKVSSCEKKLQQAGFEVETTIESIPSSTIDKNRVVKTDPANGRSVKKGTKVTIYKSSGEDTFKIEDYTGSNAIQIKTLLETKYELVVSIEKKEPEDNTKEYDDDEIIGQSLGAGSEVKKGDQLILYTPNIVDTFPDMVEEGWSISDVEAFCNKYGLILEKVEQETNAYSVGTVIGQSRTKGSTIIKGTTLKITVAIKPIPKEVPKEEPKEETTDKEKDKDKDKDKETTTNDGNQQTGEE